MLGAAYLITIRGGPPQFMGGVSAAQVTYAPDSANEGVYSGAKRPCYLETDRITAFCAVCKLLGVIYP